jgi:tetratricopeptide (TPR) repeat protein
LLGTVHQQLAIIDELRRNSRGPLRGELLAAQARWAEFAGWLCDDMGDLVAGGVWADRAMEMAQESDDPMWVGYILARKAQRAGRTGDADRTVGLGQAARRVAELPPLARAFAHLQEASGHALAGETHDCEAALAAAHNLVAGNTDTANSGAAELGGFCTTSYVQLHEAECWLTQGRPDQAISTLEAALDTWPTSMERDRGLCLTRLASAHLAGDQPDLDQAGLAAQQALRVGITAGSAPWT